MHLLHLPLPSLVSLDSRFRDPDLFQDSLFPKFSPDIRRFRIFFKRNTRQGYVYQIRTQLYFPLAKPLVCGLPCSRLGHGRSRTSVPHACIDPARIRAERYIASCRLAPFLLQLAQNEIAI